ncbi:hypothetical protein E2C01_078721 [Portunus trituberculatus]|uniref:Uncharacterized protein n=1 Tax=Portunus trituberculatus TaxID=210409 RepID=A0A5B7IQZ8_PORTR|nr:hypothetical protein [Portunus trituberculatus]
MQDVWLCVGLSLGWWWWWCAGQLLCALEVLRPHWCRGLTGFLPTHIYLQKKESVLPDKDRHL